ncbi:MAG: amidohydrolase family protein [Proteobacteria bacterium]|nr:amidohydrolase family protein [Pseudomonadota bacterium]
MKIDCHVHLVGDSAESGCYISPRMKRSIAYRFILRKFGLNRIEDPVEREQSYIRKLEGFVRQSEVDRAVLLAFDEVYDKTGALNRQRTHTYVSNDFVSRVCRNNPELFLFGASVQPYRKDALDELDRVAALGAVLVKLLPNSQGFDPSDPRLGPYYHKLADLGLPLLIHGGYEHTIPVIDQSFGDPMRLRSALDEGATIIVAHAGTAGLTHPKETMGAFLELAANYSNCYGDSSALTNFWRAKYLKQLLDPEKLLRKYKVRIDDPMSRLIHGSDFPIPITPFSFRFSLNANDRRQIRNIESPLQKDIELKRLLGVPDACLFRAYDELGIGKA